jgi:uncharacterized protein YcgL (UPF0745 family)
MASQKDRLITIYRSPREEGLYLYTAHDELLDRVPEELLKRFGTPEVVMRLQLDENRKLARADAGDVLSAIAIKGYYLQLAPTAHTQVINYDR